MKAFIQHALTLICSLGVIFCFGQDDYERFSKKEMRLLLLKRDSTIKSNQDQILRYSELTKDLNQKISNKKDSLSNFDFRIKFLNSEKNNLEEDVRRLKKENSDLLNLKNKQEDQLAALNSEIEQNNERVLNLDKDLLSCSNERQALLESTKSLSDSVIALGQMLDSLGKSDVGKSISLVTSSSDILNRMYFNNEYPKELHASLELSGVIITSLNGGYNDNGSNRDDYNLDEYIRTSHSSYDYDWSRDYYSNGNWNSYDNDYRNPKWQVFFATEFIPKSKLSVTNMNGTSRSLNFKFDLLNGMMIKLSNDHLEENTFLCQWKTDNNFGKRVVLWNLAHEKAGEMRDLFMRTFEINGEAYIALNNFQLLRLKNGFAPIQYDYNQESEYYTFEGLSGNNKILTRLKDEKSQSAVLDPAYCIYLFKLVK